MKNPVLLYLLALPFVLFNSCTSSSTSNSSNEPVSKDTTKTDTLSKVVNVDTVLPALEFDRKFNDFARYIAGMPQQGNSVLNHLDTNSFYGRYSAVTDQNWLDMENKRLSLMRTWTKDELGNKLNDTLPLFYPFSGPDFLHAFTLFPKSSRYLFMAGEGVGRIPELDKMDKTKLNDYLQNIENSLGDIYKKSYFITRRMAQDLNFEKANGVIPVFMIFLVRTNNEILNIEPVNVTREGTIVKLGEVADTNKVKLIKGVRFTFRNLSNPKPREVVYLQADISDNGIALHPETIQLINSLNCANTFVKSASYLMHYNTFSKIREAVKNVSRSVLQDDTGIALKYLNNQEWEYFLYGKYAKPVADFKGVEQPLLDSLYKTHKYVKPLPFSLGYHWGTRFQNYMLFNKIKPCLN